MGVSPGVAVHGHLCVEQPCRVYLRPAICMTKLLRVDASVAWRCQAGLKSRPGALNLFFPKPL